MSNWKWKATGLAMAGLVGGGVHGCSNAASDCERLGNCAQAGAGGAQGQGGSTSSMGGGGGDGGSGGGAPACVPDVTPAEGGCPQEQAGIFVRLEGDDSAPGTFAEPVQTLARAAELAEAGDRVIFACAQTFEEGIELAYGVSLFGGLDCDGDWRWSADSPTVIAPLTASEVPLTVLPSGGSSSDGGSIEDVELVARDATSPGSSSIALRATDTAADLVRAVLRPGRGADGSPGADAPQTLAATGANGLPGKAQNCNTPSGSQTGGAAVSSCGSTGGEGGTGYLSFGSSGDDGLPPQFLSGQGINGQPSSGTWICDNQFKIGAATPQAAAGEGGDGSGHFDASGAFIGAPGTDGTPGAPGGGGGGGGGGKRYNGSCDPSISNPVGASGGSGGAGGCGGAPGGGGGAGGSSIGVASVRSVITLRDSHIVLDNGGTGGPGGDGQPGGLGGSGGPGGAVDACNAGGPGGAGGTGGPGGGGRGGHSVGSVYVDAPVVLENTDVELNDGGTGGTGADSSAAGASGLSIPQLEVTQS